jgi:hypothetical protein
MTNAKHIRRPSPLPAIVSLAWLTTLVGQARGALPDPWHDRPLTGYAVPAISNEKRLPDRLPRDGYPSDRLPVVGARGEIVPASFVLVAKTTFPAVRLDVADLRNGEAAIPADALDLRVVKCWFQGGTAWHSYFADPDRRVLVPELLLHDENLIRVDHETRENYLRVDDPAGSRYLWVSYPQQARGALNVFNHAEEPVADAPALQPVRLEAGAGKQFWLTVRIPESAAPGLYTGAIAIRAGDQLLGAMQVNLRVLPFVLPAPKTYHDLNADFVTMLYNHSQLDIHAELLGDDREAAGRKVLAELKNQRDHNVTSLLLHRSGSRDYTSTSTAARQFALMREAGMSTDPIFGYLLVYNWDLLYRYLQAGQTIPPGKWRNLVDHADGQIDLVRQTLGHANIYGVGWDEPGRSVLQAQLPLFALLHDRGLGIYSTGKDSHLTFAGFNEDIVNYPGHPFKAESARKWHAIGARIFSYAGPHTGPENPDFIRRTHGLQLYKADYDGSANYRYYGYRQNTWNDFENGQYRICFVYPTREGIVDTLHWEGFREAIDDIRYATKLRQKAFEAIAGGGAEARYTGKKALQYLATLDEHNADLNTVRLEMIDHILKLYAVLEGDKP